VLAAFGATGIPVLQSGGQGRTWRVGDLILKPCDHPAEGVWTVEVLSTLTPSARFRVAAPVAAREGGWVVSGWQAWHAVTGEPDITRCVEVLDVADAFHQAIAGLPRPAFLGTRDDPWTYADRVAWEELPVNPHGAMAELLQRLTVARRPVDLPAQPVHGDLLGNVLFAEDQPPAVIDWPVYFRPALWGTVCRRGRRAHLVRRARGIGWSTQRPPRLGPDAHPRADLPHRHQRRLPADPLAGAGTPENYQPFVDLVLRHLS
jgi:uncharacterized protein (TIGR02569 family)